MLNNSESKDLKDYLNFHKERFFYTLKKLDNILNKFDHLG
jgi:hypothetical protein